MADKNNMWRQENPWLGLGSYNEGQTIYGRDNEISALTDIILNHPAIVLYGKSGIGKSSLLKAGVFPRLRHNAFIPVYIRLVHNTRISYVQQIINALNDNLSVNDLLPSSFPDMGLWDYLHRNLFFDSTGKEVTPVIILDQFEEVFTLTDNDHKNEIPCFFRELADALNDVKPEKVLEAEIKFKKAQKFDFTQTRSSGFIIQAPSAKDALAYNLNPSFRFVFSIRDDSLYLLERNSSKIPALKLNRFNLDALEEDKAMEVITKPLPGLFSQEEASRILDGLAYYEYEDYRVVDPAILSLFLFSYYREKGKVSYNDIFERYYQENTQPKLIKGCSVAYIEDNLLTERGNRNQIPIDDIYAAGVSKDEMSLLLDSKILKTEKRKGTEYVEFSHDRLCEQALKNRQNRKTKEERHKMRRQLMLLTLASFAALSLISFYFWQNSRYSTVLKLNKELSAKTDSLNKSNKINNKLNLSLAEQNKEIQSQRDSLSMALSINNKQNRRIERQRDSLILVDRKNRILTDSLKTTLIINNKQRQRIERQSDSLMIVYQKNLVLTDSLINVILINSAQRETIAAKTDSIQKVESQKQQLQNSPRIRQALPDYIITADGIDISKHQGAINWEQVSNNHKNIQFVYIKATEGSEYIDPCYANNIANARKNGFKVGSYHFLSTKSSIYSQAQNFIQTVTQYQQDLIPVVDIETMGAWTSHELRDSVRLFLNIVQQHFETKPMIYTSEKFFNRNLGREFTEYPLWIAKYSTLAPNIGYKWILWQFSDIAPVSGVEGNRGDVDVSRFNEGTSLKDILYLKEQ